MTTVVLLTSTAFTKRLAVNLDSLEHFMNSVPRIFSPQTSLYLVGVITSLLVLSLAGCERRMTVTMNDANPPTFQLSGSGRLIFFTVYESVQGRPSIDDPKCGRFVRLTRT
jgi:hypothetical protein